MRSAPRSACSRRWATATGPSPAKYLIYAGSATLIGWCLGFFSGTWMLPQVFWYAYRSLYDFAPLSYLFSPALAGLTLAVALIAILGSTYLSCRKELGSQPAALLRPPGRQVGQPHPARTGRFSVAAADLSAKDHPAQHVPLQTAAGDDAGGQHAI